MTDKKTPGQRALAFARDGKYQVREFGCLSGTEATAYDSFLAGRADFIANELPGLLEKARKVHFPRDDWYYSVADLLAMAEKGET